jgi:hypothetical protein
MTAAPDVLPGSSARQWQQLAEQLAPGATAFDIDYFAQVCMRVELSPFTSPPQIVLIGRHDSRLGRVVYRPQVTVDGRLALAVRSGRVVGLDGPHFTGPRTEWTDPHGQRIWVDMWDSKDESSYPRAARYLIHVAGWTIPVNGTAPWLEFAQVDSKGKLLPLWRRMPTVMLAKTALSLGLRRAGIENLPADVAAHFEGDPDHDLAQTPGGEIPAPAAIPSGRGGANDLDTAVAGYSSEELLAAYERRWRREQTPPDVTDSAPESADLEPVDDEDYSRPFGDDE